MYKAVKISKGNGGWGGPLVVKADEKRNKILCVTGGGIHPVAEKLAEMTGCTTVDGFSTGCPDDEVLVAVVDCGGTARCGVYPKKGIYTINLMPVGQSGPLAKFITEDLYVSAVTEKDLSFADEADAAAAAQASAAQASAAQAADAPKTKEQAKKEI
ncbi:MAG: PTS sorbitol transporter subunit IIB, partial [Eubacterium sp.]|nr:PTS sorbitol transporter subunit IIB [Eubacterium sp.]